MYVRMVCRILVFGFIVSPALWPDDAWARRLRSGEHVYREKSVGTFVNTPIDTNQDGLPATLSLLRGKTSVGQMTGETLGEFAPAVPPTGACAANAFELQMVPGSGVGINRFDRGDILILAPTSSVLCAAPDGTGVFINRGVFQSHGSTGRFVGVSGTWETNGQVTGLVVDQFGQIQIGTLSFAIEGTLVLP